jgi:hypothetical protein
MVTFDAQLIATIVICSIGISTLVGVYIYATYIRIMQPPHNDSDIDPS